jgi:hypothetical protein
MMTGDENLSEEVKYFFGFSFLRYEGVLVVEFVTE